MSGERFVGLVHLFRSAVEACQHEQFSGPDSDGERAGWLAHRVRDRLSALVGRPLDEAALAQALSTAERERKSRSSRSDPAEYYATWLMTRYGQSGH